MPYYDALWPFDFMCYTTVTTTQHNYSDQNVVSQYYIISHVHLGIKNKRLLAVNYALEL